MVGGNYLRSKLGCICGKIKSKAYRSGEDNTLSIDRLTLLKAVLGSTPIYPMSLYKVPKTVLHEMESLRGLGVSSYYALNRALLFNGCGDNFPNVIIPLWIHSFQPCMVLLSRHALLSILAELVVYYSRLKYSALKSFKMIDGHDLNGWDFYVKDARDLVDGAFFFQRRMLATRCIKTIPIKLNVFRVENSPAGIAIPTISNLLKRSRWWNAFLGSPVYSLYGLVGVV
ncbi:hypothetical protein Tco_0534436 [Tanacetum coccineum]